MRHPNILNIIMVSDLGAIHTAILSILGTTSEKIKSKKRDFGPKGTKTQLILEQKKGHIV